MKKIAVIGSGTMGNGIAHVFAMKDYKVNLIDISPSALEKALNTISKNLDRMVKKELISESLKTETLTNITTMDSIEKGVMDADLVIEAATENEAIKLKIFKDIDLFAPKHTILASNTSSISITKIGAATNRPEKVIGMHFMNPAPVMKLVEIIRGYSTDQEVCETVKTITEKLGKIPLEAKDYPGFVANRILIPMINEAIIALHEGVAGVLEIDGVMKLGMAHPMGPLELADFIGLDVVLAISNVLYQGFGHPKYAPCPLLVNMVTAGKLGKKSGEGFYSYSSETKEISVSNSFAR